MVLLQWTIHMKSAGMDLPKAILMPVFGPPKPALAPELAALLPSNADPSGWVRELPKGPDEKSGLCAGVFLGNPLLQRQRVLFDLKTANLPWVCNLPSVCQHDPDFVTNLDEVDLGMARELANLAACAEEGFRCIASVATPEDARRAVQMGFRTLFVLPKVRAYESGFPSELTRTRAVAAVADVSEAADVTLLSLVKSSETMATVVWPTQVQGVIEQPQPV
ncbi:MAG: hypothetical protein AAGB07_03020 [Pseudomonadota bacterium]